MITLTLLHPSQSSPVQSWTFDNEQSIRIGRSKDNDVVLYSAVVSRHHAELRHNGNEWEVFSLGSNGTYVDSEAITQVTVEDGMTFRLGSSGPKIQILLGKTDPNAVIKMVKEKRSTSSAESQFRETDTFLTVPYQDSEE